MVQGEDGKYSLSYAGNSVQIFDPKRLQIDETGHFLHPLDSHTLK